MGTTLAHQQASADSDATPTSVVVPVMTQEPEEEAAPITDETAKEDLPKRSEEELAKEAELLQAQAKADMEAAKRPKAAPAKGPVEVLIHNTTGRLFTAALFTPIDPARPGASSKNFILPPGVHPVSATQWEKAKGEKMIGLLIDDGQLEEVHAKSLGELNEKKACDLVDLVTSPKLLADWNWSEKRPRVKAQLLAQIGKITPSKSKPVQEDEDQE